MSEDKDEPVPAIEEPEEEEEEQKEQEKEEEQDVEPLNETEEEEAEEEGDKNEDEQGEEDKEDLVPEEEPEEIDLTRARAKTGHDKEQEQRNEIVRFLREFARNPQQNYISVARACQISKNTANNYVRRFNALMINTLGDSNFPARPFRALNKGVSEHDRLTTDEIVALKKPLLEKYSNYEIVDDRGTQVDGGITEVLKDQEHTKNLKQNTENERREIEKNNSNLVNTRPVVNTVGNTTGSYNQQTQQVQQQEPETNQNLAQLQNSSNSRLMAWVLQKTPLVFTNKIPSWMELFEANEQHYMMNPMDLLVDLQGHFGAKAGENAFRRFKQLGPVYLRRDQGFFNDPWNPQDYNPYGAAMAAGGQGMGGMGMNPQMGMGGFGQQMHPAVPPGIPLNSPMAMQLIERYEQQRQDQMQYDRMQRTLQQYMTTKMMDLAEHKNNGDGFGGGAGGYQGMVAAGLLIPVQTVSPEGEVAIRYEPARNAAFQSQQQQQNYGLEVTKVMMEMYNNVLSKQNEASKAYEPIVQASINKMLNANPVQDMVAYKEMMDKWNPQGNQSQNIDIAKLKLEEFKIGEDVRMARSHEDREWDRYRWEKEREDRMEAQAAENTHSLIGGIINMTSNNIDKILALLFNRQGQQISGYPQQMPPQQYQPQQQYTPEQIQEIERQNYIRRMREMQGQQPQQRVVRRQPTPYELEMIRRQRMEQSREMSQGYIPPGQYQQQQPQPQQQQRVHPSHIHQNTVKRYSPRDFEHLTPEELAEVEEKGRQSYESIISFMDSIQAAKYSKLGGNPSQEEIEQQELQEQEIQPIENERGWPGQSGEKELIVQETEQGELQPSEEATNGDVV